MDVSAVTIICAFCLSGVTLTVQLLFRLRDRREERQLLLDVLNKTGSADAFGRYTELRAAERLVIIVKEKPADIEPVPAAFADFTPQAVADLLADPRADHNRPAPQPQPTTTQDQLRDLTGHTGSSPPDKYCGLRRNGP